VDAFRAALEEIAARRELEVDVGTITRDDPAVCSPVVVDAVRNACDELGQPYLDVISGAYHDAMVLGAHVPIGMIFVPSVGGIDMHVHCDEPGRTEWEGFATATAALAAGGLTTFVDMPLNSTPATVDADTFARKVRAAEVNARVDFGLWGGLVPGRLDELEA